jgi:hypothetical protein
MEAQKENAVVVRHGAHYSRLASSAWRV